MTKKFKKAITISAEIFNILIIALAFFALVFDASWKHYVIGWCLGYALATSIEKITRVWMA